jgi:hypothetical protein
MQPKPTKEQQNSPPPTPILSDALKVLFIGNSYTFFYQMPNTFAKLMEASGHPVFVGMASKPAAHFPNTLDPSRPKI